MKILIIAVYLVALTLQSINAQCPITCSELLLCPNDKKPGQIIDANDCLIWTCVPIQPLCCPQTSKDDLKCEAELEPSLIMDFKTGCNIWTCVPKQPKCCPLTYPTWGCSKGFYNFQVYDPKTGCLYWTCVPLCEVPPPAALCPIDTKLGHIYQPFDKCLNWGCVPIVPTCCRRTSPNMLNCTAESEPGLVMDPSTGCKYWQCVPKQPYCCKTYPVKNCTAPMYNVQVYDETGCFAWQCRPESRHWICGTPVGIPIKLG